jgi:hypothetical protein
MNDPEKCKTCGGSGAVELGSDDEEPHLEECPDCTPADPLKP